MKLTLYATAAAAALVGAEAACDAADIEAIAKCALTTSTGSDVRPHARFAAATLAHCVSLAGHEQQRVQLHE
jgi:hypothetical protein